MLSVADPGSGAFLTPESGIWNRFSLDPGSKLTCDLGLFLVESFSGFKVLSFDVFWDLGRWLIHCRAV